jgi:hypothetical protein
MVSSLQRLKRSTCHLRHDLRGLQRYDVVVARPQRDHFHKEYRGTCRRIRPPSLIRFGPTECVQYQPLCERRRQRHSPGLCSLQGAGSSRRRLFKVPSRQGGRLFLIVCGTSILKRWSLSDSSTQMLRDQKRRFFLQPPEPSTTLSG